MTKIAIKDCDIIFLSYDEPNAEKNYSDLRRKIPWAKRVHGIKGFDNAHKACAELSDTEYFITVDGDTQINPKILDITLDLDAMGIDNSYIFSWSGHINVNGLRYGNGSIKLWTRKFVRDMRTHENYSGNDKNEIEFCFFKKLIQFNENYSTSYINSTAKQAWRAGFREGVKMSINKNTKVRSLKSLWWQNYHRLLIWMMVGMDVENGIFAIHGAREGCYKTVGTDWDLLLARDFNELDKLFLEKKQEIFLDKSRCLEEIRTLGQLLIQNQSLELSADPLSVEQSKFFKKVYINSPRTIRKTV